MLVLCIKICWSQTCLVWAMVSNVGIIYNLLCHYYGFVLCITMHILSNLKVFITSMGIQSII